MQTPRFRFLLFGILMLLSLVQKAQSPYETIEEEPEEERSKMLSFTIGYGYEIPGGDLKERYGNDLKFSLGAQYLNGKNYLFEADFNLMFSNNVKEDVVSNLRNQNGRIIGSNGGLTDVFLRQRGFFLGGVAGKLFTLPGSQSGIRLAGGLGVLSHNIRILDETGGVAQLNGDYLKGYDRLTRGFALRQQLGYEVHSLNGRINLNIMFEMTQAVTNSVRKYNFNSGPVPEGGRLDLLYCLRATWMLPIIRRSVVQKQIYY